MRDFRNLQVWQKAHRLALRVYLETRCFPKEELYGLTSQLRRAGGSIPANIAEGCGRFGECELARFLDIASGSASELEYHLLLANDLELLRAGPYEDLTAAVQEVKQTLASLLRKIRKPDC